MLYRFFSSCGASHCGGFSCCGTQALGMRASLAVAHGLRSCSSRALECRLNSCGTELRCRQHVGSSWITDQTLCLLHWQVDSSPLSHRGSPGPFFNKPDVVGKEMKPFLYLTPYVKTFPRGLYIQ